MVEISGFWAKLRSALVEAYETLLSRIFSILKTKMIEEIRAEIAIGSIDESLFQTEEIRTKVKELKSNWRHSPASAREIAEDIVQVIIGKVSKLQLEAITGISIDEKTPISDRIFTQIAIVTDVCLLTSIMGIVGTFVPFTNLSEIGREIRAYLDYSGLSQIVGFGYGMMLSSVLTPFVNKEILAKTRPEILSPAETIRLFFRKTIPEEEAVKRVEKWGYNQEEWRLMKEDFMYYPTVSDFISFAVKEVYDEKVVKLLGYDEGYPGIAEEAVARAGLSPEWFKLYWRAHWQPISPTMAYEMFHRGVISIEDLKFILRIADYPPGFLDKLIAIAYAPYTRVDIRRMYTEGVLTVEEVKKAYLEIGYDDTKATKLTEWTTREKTKKERELSLEMIKKGFYYGAINETKTKLLLEEIGYSSEESELIIHLWKYELQKKDYRDVLKDLKSGYFSDLISEAEIKTELARWDLSEEKIEIVIQKWKRERRSKTVLPSVDRIQKWYSLKIIPVETAMELLKANNVREEHLEYYVKEAVIRKR